MSAQDLTLEADALALGEADYVRLPFSVPAGVQELEVRRVVESARNVIDFGLESPSGSRGWGGGNDEPIITGLASSSRSYISGNIEEGEWQLVVGKALVVDAPARFSVEIFFRDAATLGAQDRAPYVARAALEGTARYYAGDFHVHSRESGDALASFEEIDSLAQSLGLDFVLLTEHNTVSHLELLPSDSATLMIPGIELTTYGGHANLLGARDFVDHTRVPLLPGVLDEVARQGALFSVNHPTLDLGDTCLGCAWEQEGALDGAHAVEIQTGGAPLFVESAIGFWDSHNDRGARLCALGGSDDHRAGIDLGLGQSPIGSPTTMVFARELSEAAILEGVRACKTVVKLTGADGPMLEVESDPARAEDAPVVLGQTTRITARATDLGEEAELELVFFEDGLEMARVVVIEDPFEATFEGEAGHRYRAELHRPSGRRVTIASDVWVDAPPKEVAPGCGCSSAGRQRGFSAVPFALSFLSILVFIMRKRSRYEEDAQ